MKRMKLVIDIDEELFNYIQEEKNDKHLDQRFDYKIRHSIKNGTPLQTVLEDIKRKIENVGILKKGFFEYHFKSPKELKDEILEIINKRISELEGENKMEKEYELGNCPRCQKTDLVIADKKVICKSCSNWSWLEDAYNSSWLKELNEHIKENKK